MDIVSLLLLAGACHESVCAMQGKTYEEAWALAGNGWREWSLNCGSGESCGSGYCYGDGDGSGHGSDYGYGYGYGDGGGNGEGVGLGDGSRYWAGSGKGYGYGHDLEIWHDGDWRGREWARSEIALLVAKMK